MTQRYSHVLIIFKKLLKNSSLICSHCKTSVIKKTNDLNTIMYASMFTSDNGLKTSKKCYLINTIGCSQLYKPSVMSYLDCGPPMFSLPFCDWHTPSVMMLIFWRHVRVKQILLYAVLVYAFKNKGCKLKYNFEKGIIKYWGMWIILICITFCRVLLYNTVFYRGIAEFNKLEW